MASSWHSAESSITARLVRGIQVKKCTSDCQPETSFEPIPHLQGFECCDPKEEEKYREVGTQSYLSHFSPLHSLTVTCVDRSPRSCFRISVRKVLLVRSNCDRDSGHCSDTLVVR